MTPESILDSWAATHRKGIVPGLRRSLAADRDKWGPRILALAAQYQGEPIDPSGPLPAPRNRAVIHTFLNSWSGYGQFGEHLGRGLETAGVPVVYWPTTRDTEFFPVSEFQEARAQGDPPDPWALTVHFPGRPARPGRANVLYTMWEASRVPDGWIETMGRYAAVVVPCAWLRETFREQGVSAPIRVVPGGIDPSEGYFDDGTPPPESPGGPIRVGMAARLAHGGCRKGIREGIAAFLDAFPPKIRDVELVVKLWPDCPRYLGSVPDDPRIRIIAEPMAPREMAAWTRTLSVLLVPSKGEGWGLHTLQAMAVGRPVIAALATATADFVDESVGYPLDYRWGPAVEYYGHPGAEWAVPSHDSMVAQLRAVRDDPGLAQAKGKAAAARAAQFTWAAAGRKLRDVLEEVGMIGPATGKEEMKPMSEDEEIARRRASKPRGSLARTIRANGNGKGKGS